MVNNSLSENNENIYLPRPALIDRVLVENSQIKTFALVFQDDEYNRSFVYRPGQFMMLSVPHCGEAPISFSSTPTRPGIIHLSLRKAGQLTTAMHELGPGAIVGLRGPYGRHFPLEDLQGRDLLFLAGGIGLAPLRSVINFCLDRGLEYGRINILYGSRLPSDIAFRADIDNWRQQPTVNCLLTVDAAEPGWDGPVGVVTTLLDRIDIDINNCTALVCGPPLMIRFGIAELSRMGFKDEDIITTMERHMKCGIGTCGHCYLEEKLVCRDGPVFSRAELKDYNIMEFMS